MIYIFLSILFLCVIISLAAIVVDKKYPEIFPTLFPIFHDDNSGRWNSLTFNSSPYLTNVLRNLHLLKLSGMAQVVVANTKDFFKRIVRAILKPYGLTI